jgi:hypothetical protein
MTEIVRQKPFEPPSRGERALTTLARAALLTARRVRERHATNNWPDDRDIDLLLRAPTTPASTTDAGALMQIALHFVASLVPVSAAAAVIARSLQLSFDSAGQISVPNLTLPNAAWVGEGQAIPVVEGTSSAGSLIVPHKLAVIVPLTGEMIRNSNAERIVRQVLLENVAKTLDGALFSANAPVPGLSPGGIVDGVAPLPPSDAGSALDNMVGDIGNIAAAIAPTAGASTPVLVASPRQAVALAMRAPRDLWPVLMSAALPDKTIIALTPAALATVIEPPRIESSGATVHMEEATPGDIVDIGGVLAYPVKSLWQSDSVAIRFILPATWGRRSAAAVAWIENVAW